MPEKKKLYNSLSKTISMSSVSDFCDGSGVNAVSESSDALACERSKFKIGYEPDKILATAIFEINGSLPMLLMCNLLTVIFEDLIIRNIDLVNGLIAGFFDCFLSLFLPLFLNTNEKKE